MEEVAVDLTKVKLFDGLTREEIDNICSKAGRRVYPGGSTVFVGGQEADGLYIIMSGRAKVLMLYPDGREKTLAILGPGETMGELILYGSDFRSANVETMETTTFLVIPRERIRAMLLETPGLAVKLIELLSGRLRKANIQIEELTFHNARSRVICTMVHLAEEHGRKAGLETQLLFSLTHAELAKLVGVTRETVTKILSELQQKKLINFNRSGVRVANLAKLKEEAF
jgi:CRP/FNR family transcriptional regulator, cyclic AMP receptor protein